ncbi:MAG: rod shape-determining protein MreD [Vicinamibacterales bacterium]
MKLALNLAALAAALAIQTTLTQYVRGTAALDFVLIMVVSLALTSGPITGVVAGSAAGLVQDALSSGVVGIGALAKTIVGFFAGRLGTQFIVTAPLPRFVVFMAATLVHAALFMGLYTLLGLRTFPNPYAAIGGQAVGNAVVGVLGFQVSEWLPGFLARRRLRRPTRR